MKEFLASDVPIPLEIISGENTVAEQYFDEQMNELAKGSKADSVMIWRIVNAIYVATDALSRDLRRARQVGGRTRKCWEIFCRQGSDFSCTSAFGSRREDFRFGDQMGLRMSWRPLAAARHA